MDPFEEYLREHSALRTLLVTPGGNHGDTLIHMGHLKKLEEHGFNYTCFNLEESYSRNPVLAAKYLVNIGLWKMGAKEGFRLVDVPGDTELIQGAGPIGIMHATLAKMAGASKVIISDVVTKRLEVV